MQVANLYAPSNNSKIQRQQFPLGDSAWHHLGLTTFPQGGRGFQMYIDGQVVGEMNPNNTYSGMPLTALVVLVSGPWGPIPRVPLHPNKGKCPQLAYLETAFGRYLALIGVCRGICHPADAATSTCMCSPRKLPD